MPFRTPFVALVLALLFAPRVASAGEAAAAQALFDEARQLVAQGQYAKACPKLEESQQLDPGIGTQFHLADCLQHVGRSASAWAMFREVESQAHALMQEGRERVAHDRATALEPFLSRLLIAPQSAGVNRQIEVLRDGVAIGRGEWDLPVPVDPGTHVVALVAPGKRFWETRADVPGDGRVVRVDLPPLSNLPDQAGPAEPSSQPAAPPPAPVAPARPRPQREGIAQAMPPSEDGPTLEDHGVFQRGLGWFLVGAGTVGLGAAAYFGFTWNDNHNRQLSHCPGNGCDAVGIAAQDAMRKDTKDAEAAAAVGGGTLLIGTLVVLTAPGPRLVVNNAATLEVAPMAAASRGGIVVRGLW